MHEHLPDMDRENVHAIGIATSLGITMVVVLIVFIGGGIWLDQKFDTAPILTLLGIAFGLIGAGYQLYELMLFGRKDRENGPVGKSLTRAFSRKS